MLREQIPTENPIPNCMDQRGRIGQETSMPNTKETKVPSGITRGENHWGVRTLSNDNHVQELEEEIR